MTDAKLSFSCSCPELECENSPFPGNCPHCVTLDEVIDLMHSSIGEHQAPCLDYTPNRAEILRQEGAMPEAISSGLVYSGTFESGAHWRVILLGSPAS